MKPYEKIDKYEKNGWSLYALFEAVCKRQGEDLGEVIVDEMSGSTCDVLLDDIERTMEDHVEKYFEDNPHVVLDDGKKSVMGNYAFCVKVIRADES